MDRGRRTRDLVHGSASLVALVAIVFGLPLGLIGAVGSPLPDSVPRWSAVVHALSESQVADSTLVKAAALVCLVAWAALTMCIAVEVIAWVRGQTAARLPVVEPFQVWAGRLVASALLVFSSVAGVVRPAVASPLQRPAPIARVSGTPRPLQVSSSGGSSPEEQAVAVRGALPQPAGAKRYVVEPPDGRRRDTLWGIAERHLGNPERWPEIFQLNKGRASAGHRITNPHWIYPGEELIMPADAVGLEPLGEVPSVAAPAPMTVAPPPVVEPPAAVPSSVAPPTSSSVEMQVVPDDQSKPQAAGDTVEKRSDSWRVARTVTDLVPARITTPDLVVGGLLAAGVIAAVDRRRRSRQRRRRAGAAFLVPARDLAATELGLRLAADVEGVELVQLALNLVRRVDAAAGILGLVLGPRQVAIRFAEAPGPVKAPFRVVGESWVLPRRALTAELVADLLLEPSVQLPLVTLGTTDEDETVLLNLEVAQSVSLAGSREIGLEFLLAAATELAHGPAIESRRLVAVGLGDELGELAGLEVLAEVRDLEPGDVLVSGQPLVDAVPAGVVTLAIGPLPGARYRLVVGEDRLEVEALDAVVRPQRLPRRVVADIADLLEPPPDPPEEAVPMDFPSPQPEPAHGPEVEVRVLGPVEVVGGEKPLVRAKSIELIAFLAVHSEAVVDSDRLREALWPGKPPGTTLYTTASVARSCLGRASDGEHHLPPLPNGSHIYRLGKAVGSDYGRFASLVRQAKTAPAADAMVSLRSALELVRGRPFEVAGREFSWAHVEGLVVSIESEIASAAHQLASLSLEAGDAEGARWATRQGLRANRGNEQLYRDLMKAADLDGNPAAVEALLNELAHIVEEEAPLATLHPETVALYHRLTAGESPRLARTG